MPNLNKVMLMGNLTNDPEPRTTPQGIAVTKFGLAVNRRYKTAAGELKEDTLFIDVSTFAKQAETVSKFLKKGAAVYVEGRLKLDRWDDKNTGQKKSKIHIIAERVHFLSSRKERTPDNGHDAEPVGAATGAQSDDDIPF